jgi:hypothetical protein
LNGGQEAGKKDPVQAAVIYIVILLVKAFQNLLSRADQIRAEHQQTSDELVETVKRSPGIDLG